ncbi:MAG: aldehyde dehydrogenase family protein, partial [Acetobacteraceae bacterium]|nr:aldehyde dehydrogenase family protein [Acetobacteraceae bacterium]
MTCQGSTPPRSAEALAAARAAQPAWAAIPLAQRLALLGRVRRTIARDPAPLLASLSHKRPDADTLAAELLPLADAIRFLERAAPGLLRPRALHGGRPLWLSGVAASIRREPVGVVLILAPANFPLMLPGIQTVQALAAGNAVCVKPAPGCAAPMRALAEMLHRAGLPADVLHILSEDTATGATASAAGFDLIVLTGSAATGQAVLAATAAALTPAIMELSGCDPMFVLPSADLALVADCLAFALRLNDGATCIAPRRVYVPEHRIPALESALRERLAGRAHIPPPAAVADAIAEAQRAGARVCGPLVVHPSKAARSALRLFRDDLFAPVVSLIPVGSTEEALAADRACPYALGASVFGAPAEARALVPRLRAGSVVVNDVIVPTADPRLPFGGRGRSGFGVTRGAEGLLALTVAKAVSVRRGRFRPHLRRPTPSDAAMLRALLQLLHGGARDRMTALRSLARRRRPPQRGAGSGE